jgi:drug/metabolite transporter (DMT)-like permease
MSNTEAAPTGSLTLAALAMTGSAACWGFATVMTKGALAHIPPFTLLAIQLAASVTFLWIAALALGHRAGMNRKTARAASTGLFEPGLAYGLGVPGLALTTAANASVIGAMEPAIILLVVWLLYGTRPHAGLVSAIAVAMTGVGLMTGAELTGLGAGDIRGDALVFLGTACAALYVVTSSKLVADFAPLPLSALQQSVGLVAALGFLAIALATSFETLPATIDPSVLALAITSGIVQYALPFWLYLIGLRTLPVGTAGLFLTLTPVFGISGGMIFLGETLTALQIAGATLAIAALVMIVRRA